MKKFLIFFCVFTLTGCCSDNAINSIANSVQSNLDSQSSAVDALEQSLRPECKTTEVMSEIKIIRTNIDSISVYTKSIVSICESKEKELESKIKTRNITIVGLLAIVVLLGVLKIKKIF